MLNLSMVIEHHARLQPDREAVLSGATRLTYGQLDAQARRVAAALRALGVRPGDSVALSCPNVAYFPVAYFAILKAGAVVVPLNVLLKGPEVAYHLRDSDARVYLCFEGTPELPMAQFGHAGFREAGTCEHFVVMAKSPEAPSPIAGARTLADLLRDQPRDQPQPPPGRNDTTLRAPDDTAVILYTSGTTGRPKGAELTHANMLLNAIASRDNALPDIGVGPGTALIALPLFHSFGQTVLMNAQLYHGSRIVLVPRFEPGPVLDLMRQERVNAFAGVPTMFWGLLDHVTRHDVDVTDIAANLKNCCSGGAAIPVEILNAFERRFGVAIFEGYGLSETAPVATFNQHARPRKPGSVGLPIFGCEVRVVDAAGADVAPGELGEIVIRGHNVMKGYYKKPEATREAIDAGGWFHSGDLARMDDEGYLYITDRLKDMIIRGGLNVYPREVEEVLHTHPAVSLAAVIGVPHAQQGEEVKAYVIRKPGAEVTEAELVAWARDAMAAYKYPRSVEFVDSLPMTATGKVLKRELRARAAATAAEGAAAAAGAAPEAAASLTV